MVYYKLRQVLQSAMDLLQIATGITKCDDYYKLRQYNSGSCGQIMGTEISGSIRRDESFHLNSSQKTRFFHTNG